MLRNFRYKTEVFLRQCLSENVRAPVAFVDSYHRFFDLHVGFPGRAGDNTVLSRYRLMDDMRADPATWLGRDKIEIQSCPTLQCVSSVRGHDTM